MSTKSIAWPQVARWMKIGSECRQTWWLDFNIGRCEMRNSVRLLVLFLAAQYMLDSSDDLLDLLAAPLFFRHTNRHRINGRKQRDREQEIWFLHYRRAIELHHYWHKVKSTSQIFRNGPVQMAPLLEFFETTLDHRSKPQEILGFQLGHLIANYSRIHLPECFYKVLMTEFMLELSTSRAGESPCEHYLWCRRKVYKWSDHFNEKSKPCAKFAQNYVMFKMCINILKAVGNAWRHHKDI